MIDDVNDYNYNNNNDNHHVIYPKKVFNCKEVMLARRKHKTERERKRER